MNTEEVKNIVDVVDTVSGNAKGVFSYIIEPRKKSEEYLVDVIKKNGKLEISDVEAATLILLARKWTKRIKNNKEIIKKANRQFDELLKQMGKTSTNTQAMNVDSDWLEYFLDMSSYTSNDVVQEIWARLLVKEHLENNSVPKSMINTLALMDNNSAKIFTNLCRLAIMYQTTDEEEEIMPLIIGAHMFYDIREEYPDEQEVFNSYESLRPSQKELELIGELGLITINTMQREYFVYFSDEKKIKFSYGEFEIESDGIRDEEDFKCIGTGLVSFTNVGVALYNTLVVDAFEEMPVLLEKFIKFQENNKEKILQSLL